ncbi:MAG: MFS transporter [Nitriliruptoraceae bacterium]|nr:MFS transporter [Nitriliruptoraceae bacterium]
MTGQHAPGSVGAVPPSDGDDPPGLGARYWRLWGAVTASNLGDGMVMIALPWLGTLLTRDALAIAGIGVATRLPWLIFSLQAGALGDRRDRRRLMVGANAVRAVVATIVAVAVLLDVMNLPLLYLAALVLGMCEVLFDNTSQALMPSLVARDRLERANGNLFGAQLVTAEFVAPPIAGALIGVALSLPFAVDAVTAAISAALIAMIPGSFQAGGPGRAPASTGEATRTSMTSSIGEGLRFLWAAPLLRRLAIALATMNGVGAAIMATYVLFVQEILGLDGLGFGLLVASSSIGGVLGSVLGPMLTRRIGPGPSMLLTLSLPIVLFATIGLSSNVWVIAASFIGFSFLAVQWNVVTVSLRQTLIPDDLLGRVNSVFRFFGWGAMPIGTLLGGILVSLLESPLGRGSALRAPFWAAVVAYVVLSTVLAPRLRTRGGHPPPPPGGTPQQPGI